MNLDPESPSTQMLDQSPLGIMVWRLEDPASDASLRLVYANPAASKMSERDLASFIDCPMYEAFPSADPERVHGYAEACRTGVGCDFGEVLYANSGVGAITFSVRAVPLPGRSVGMFLENLSSLKRAEAEAVRLNQFLDSIIEHLPAMVFLKDAESLRFKRFNRAGEELLGVPREELLDKCDHDFFPAEQADFFVAKDREVLSSGALKDIPEEPIDTPRGRRWLHTRKIPILGGIDSPGYLLGISIDITERKRAEELLRASHQQLEQRVAERTAELQGLIDERTRAQAALAQAEESLRQSQRMEAIGRLAGGVAHDFNNVLGIVLGYCESVLGQLGSGDPLREEIEQLLMNLLLNSRDAMPRGGRLTIETANASLEAAELADRPDVLPGEYVRLSVTDTGIGMDRETLGHMFDPFFTTKERGKGTGLGLSTVFGIVQQSGGAIWARSEPAHGTTFEVYFPVTDEPLPEALPSHRSAPAAGGSETIVLVEDDTPLRKIVAAQLERFGYRALSFASATEALEVAGCESVDVLLTDVVMPEMGGRELAEAFLKRSPSTHVVFMSGYTDDAVVRHGALDASVAFLQKPFTPEALVQQIRSVLHSK